MAAPPSGPLLTVRAALVLLIAIIVGMIAGLLGYVSKHDLAAAVLIAGGAAGAALLLFNTVLDR